MYLAVLRFDAIRPTCAGNVLTERLTVVGENEGFLASYTLRSLSDQIAAQRVVGLACL